MSPINLTPGDLRRKAIGKKLIWTGALIGIIILAILPYFGSQPASCGICHKREVGSWKSKSHRAVRCGKCHDSNIAVNFFTRLGEYGLFLTNLYQSPIRTRIDNLRCLTCHGKEMKKTLTADGIKVNHSGIPSGKYECTDCHVSCAHKVNRSVASKKPRSMGTCLDCHQKEAVAESGNCAYCHKNPKSVSAELRRSYALRKDPWQSLHGGDSKKNHGITNRNSCGFCHSNAKCSKCHGSSYPHYELWLTYHSSYKEGCATCHRKGFCLSCHGTEMPHPKGWYANHGKKTRNSAICNKCHSSDDCDNCHLKHIHPQVPGIKMSKKIFESPEQ